MTGMPASLSTRRLDLRRVRDGDIPAIVRGLGNWNVARWLGRVPHPYHPIHARQWIRRTAAAADNDAMAGFVIVRKGGPGVVIGGIGVNDVSARLPIIGYWLAEAHWGKGYASEALRAVLAALFDAKPGAMPVATCLPANRRSITVLERVGFKRDRRTCIAANAALRRKMRVLNFTYAGAR